VILFLCVDIGKERDRTSKYSCRSSKEAPPRFTFCGVGAGRGIHLCSVNFNPCTPEGATMQIQSVTIYFNPCVTIYFNPYTPEGVPAQIAYFLHSIYFNPCTPEGVPAQIAYFLHSIYFNPCTPEGATV